MFLFLSLFLIIVFSLWRASALWLRLSCISSSWHPSAGCWQRHGSPTWPSLAKWGHDSFASVFCASAGVSSHRITHYGKKWLRDVVTMVSIQSAGYILAPVNHNSVILDSNWVSLQDPCYFASDLPCDPSDWLNLQGNNCTWMQTRTSKDRAEKKHKGKTTTENQNSKLTCSP